MQFKAGLNIPNLVKCNSDSPNKQRIDIDCKKEMLLV